MHVNGSFMSFIIIIIALSSLSYVSSSSSLSLSTGVTDHLVNQVNTTYCTEYATETYDCNCHGCNCDTCYSCGCQVSTFSSCAFDSCSSCWCSPICRCCRSAACGSPCRCASTCCDTCSRQVCKTQVPVTLNKLAVAAGGAAGAGGTVWIQGETANILATGSGFVLTSSILCKLTNVASGGEYSVSATLLDPNSLLCMTSGMLIAPAIYQLSISLDGVNYATSPPSSLLTVVACPRSSVSGVQCSGSGTCTLDGSSSSGATCLCSNGYFGSACESRCPTNQETGFVCSGNAFVNGTCNSDGSCSCLPFSSGSVCENVCPGADVHTGSSSSACSHNGFCLADATCQCHLGFKGPNCDVVGNCSVLGDPLCRCVFDKWGPSCSFDCPRALSSGLTCDNHGTCSPLDGQCYCEPGYFGSTCSSTCPGGAVMPCNGRSVSGTCTAIDGRCVCENGYFGDACENTCPGGSASPCSNAGVCLSDGSCVCASGHTGPDCSLICPHVDTSNVSSVCGGSDHGDCVVVFDSGSTMSAVCSCKSGYFGAMCEKSCAALCRPPQSNGACQQSTGQCSCVYGYTGPTCQNECPGGVSSPCSQHGLCSISSTNNTLSVCTCLPGYYGTACEHTCPMSASSPPRICNGHGTCDTVNGTCLCDPSYAGPACTQRYCPYACYQHGSCWNGTCVCESAWSGPYCSTFVDNNDTSILHGALSFLTSSAGIEESSPTLLLSLRRHNGTHGVVRALVETQPLTALPGLDYVSQVQVPNGGGDAGGGVVTWMDGESEDKQVTVTILQDEMPEQDEFFLVTLTHIVSGGALLIPPLSVNVTIFANSGPLTPSQLSSISYVTVRMNININATAGAKRNAFVTQMVTDVANVLNVPHDRVGVFSIQSSASDGFPDMIYVTISLIGSSSSSSSSASSASSSRQLVSIFVHLVSDSSSSLYSVDRLVTRFIDISFMPLVVTQSLPVVPPSSSDNEDVSLSASAIVGIVLASVTCVSVCLCAGCAYRHRRSLSEYALWKLGGMRFTRLNNKNNSTGTANQHHDEDDDEQHVNAITERGVAMEETKYIVD